MYEDGTSVEDIDAILDQEFSITEDSVEDNIEEDTNVVDQNDENQEDQNDENQEEETDEDGTSAQNGEEDTDDNINALKDLTNGVKKDKKAFAFEQLRKENSSLKEVKQKYDQENAFIKDMAAQYGYTDVEKFKVDYRNAQLAREAQEKGKDPELYKETAILKEKIANLERENQQKELMVKAGNFKSAVETAIKEYNLGDNGQNEIFSRLEAAGFTVDTILSLPNPKIVINGVLADKIQEASRQNQLKKMEKLDKIADIKHNANSSSGKITIDDLIKSDLEDLKANNYY